MSEWIWEVYKYCPRCGHPLEAKSVGDRLRPVCPQCGFIVYVNPTPAAGALVEHDGHVLLIRRGVPPREGYWAFPAGYVEADESVEEAAIRETREETGLQVALDGLWNVYSFEDAAHQRGVLILYRAHVVGGELRPGDDAAEARWFAPHEVPAESEIAFRTHREALREWLRARAVVYRPLREGEAKTLRELITTYKQPPLDEGVSGGHVDRLIVVADDRGEIVGYLVMDLYPDRHEALIRHVFVVPNRRRWGIGSHLITHALAKARGRDVHLVTTQISAGNVGIVVYLKVGFEVCGMVTRPDQATGRRKTWLLLCYAMSPGTAHTD